MEPKIKEYDAFQVAGTLTRITPREETGENYRLIWEGFESFRGQIEPQSIDRKYYGVSFPTAEEGIFDYLAGMAVKSVDSLPEGLVSREVPSACFTVFECSVKAIAETYPYIFGEWLPHSLYELNPTAPSFEQYPPEGEEDDPIFIHIPIKKRR